MTEPAAARELLILRHGKAKRPADVADADRPLSQRGREQADRIGALLQGRGLLPDLMVSSPAERALTTARRTAVAAGMDPAAILTDPRIYEASSAMLLAVLADRGGGAGRILLVGHNPGLEQLAGLLSGRRMAMGTGDLVRLTLAAPWAAAATAPAQLLDHVDPDGLPAI